MSTWELRAEIHLANGEVKRMSTRAEADTLEELMDSDDFEPPEAELTASEKMMATRAKFEVWMSAP